MIKKQAIVALFLLLSSILVPAMWLRFARAVEPRDAWEWVPLIETVRTQQVERNYRYLADDGETTYTLHVVTRTFTQVKREDGGTTVVLVRRLRRDLEMNPETGEITERGGAQ